MKRSLHTTPSPRPLPTRLHVSISHALAMTPRRTLERLACYLGVIGETEAPATWVLIKRVRRAL